MAGSAPQDRPVDGDATLVAMKCPIEGGAVKLSVSLSEDDVAALDRYVELAGLKSRSAAIQQAIRRLQDPGLEAAYAEAWEDWAAFGEDEVWAAADADGLADAAG